MMTKNKFKSRPIFWIIVFVFCLATLILGFISETGECGYDNTAVSLSKAETDKDKQEKKMDEGNGVEAGDIINAVKDGNITMINKLLANGADVKTRDKSHSDYTLLHWAVFLDRINIVELLLEKGADVNAKDKYQIAPLHIAVYYEKRKISQLLLQKGADRINNIEWDAYDLDKGTFTDFWRDNVRRGANEDVQGKKSITLWGSVKSDDIETARNLIEKYDEDKIMNHISWMKYREAKDEAAFLVSAIKDDWGPPKEVLEEAKKNEEKKAKTDAGQRVKNAKYIIFPSGERFKISRVFPEAVEYFIDGKQKCVVMLNLAQDCQFD